MQKENHSSRLSKDPKIINANIKRNKELEREIEDYNESVNININLVSTLFPNGDKELKPKIVETIQNYINLLDKQGKMEIESSEYEESLHKIPLDIQIYIKENEDLKNKIQEKVKIIHDLEKELHRLRKNVIINEPFEKHFILPPTSENLDLHNQLRLLNLQTSNPDELNINKKGIKMKSPDDDAKAKEKEKEKEKKGSSKKKKMENKFFLMKISSILDTTIKYLEEHSKKIKEKTKSFIGASRKASADKNDKNESDDSMEVQKKDKSFSESSSVTSSLSDTESHKSESESQNFSNENSESNHNEEEVELKIDDSYDENDPGDILIYRKRLRAIEKRNREFVKKVEKSKKNCKQLFNEIHTINKIIRKNKKIFDPNAESESSSDKDSDEEEEEEEKKKDDKKGDKTNKDKKDNTNKDKRVKSNTDKKDQNNKGEREKSTTKKVKKVVKKVVRVKDSSKLEHVKHDNASEVEKEDFKGPRMNLEKKVKSKLSNKSATNKADNNNMNDEKKVNNNVPEKMTEERESEIIAKLKKLKNPNAMKQSKIILENNNENQDNINNNIKVLKHNNELEEEIKKEIKKEDIKSDDKKDNTNDNITQNIAKKEDIKSDKIVKDEDIKEIKSDKITKDIKDEDKKLEEINLENYYTEKKNIENTPYKLENKKEIEKEIYSEKKYNDLFRAFEFKNNLGHHKKMLNSKKNSIPYPKKSNK